MDNDAGRRRKARKLPWPHVRLGPGGEKEYFFLLLALNMINFNLAQLLESRAFRARKPCLPSNKAAQPEVILSFPLSVGAERLVWSPA